MNEYEGNIKDIADKINSTEFVEIFDRPITEKDVLQLTDNQAIRVKHKNGFTFNIRRSFIIEHFLNIPTIMFSIENYWVTDELIGRFEGEFNALEAAEFTNGLIGY